MAKKPKTDWRIIVAGIVCLTVLEIVALLMGINGTLYGIIIIIIAGAIGVSIPRPEILKTK